MKNKFLISTLFTTLVAACCTVQSMSASAHSYTVDSIEIGHPYAPPALAVQPTAAAYFKSLRNTGAQADTLLSATTPVASRVEIHEMKMDGTLMQMREIPSLPLPAKSDINMSAGNGQHLMLIGLKKPLVEGERFAMTLNFERAGAVTVDVVVQAFKGGAATHQH
jgi:periplasmic copper chaperone A